MRKYISANRDVALVALVFVLAYGLPHILMLYFNGALYNPVPIENAGGSSLDEYPYAINLREALDGNLIVANAQLVERSSSGIMDFFPYAFWGLVGSIFQLNVFQLLILLDFIFPAASFVALFLLLQHAGIERRLSMLTSVLILVFNSFVHLATVILTLDVRYFDFTKSIDIFSTISRYPSPEFTFIILLGGLAALYCTFKKDDVRYPLATAVAGTVLTYSYLIYSSFFWTAVVVFSLVMILTSGEMKRAAVKAASIIVPAALLCTPYVLNYLSLSKSQGYADLLSRLILLKGRIIYSQLAHVAFSLVLMAILYLLIFRKDKLKFYFLSSIALAVIIVSNVQVVLGYTIQPDHWIIRVMDPMYFVLFALILNEGRSKASGIARSILDFALNRKVLLTVTAAVLLWILAFNFSFPLNAHGRYAFAAEEADVYNWLDANTPAGSTVLTLSVKQSAQLSYATHNTVYLPNGLITVVSNGEIVDRVLSAYNVLGVPESELLAKLNVSNDALRFEYIDDLYAGKVFSTYDFERYYFMHYLFHAGFFYGNRTYLQRNPDTPGAVGYYFPLAFRNETLEKYRSGNYSAYSYDYILAGPYEKQIAVASLENSHKKVYSNAEFALFDAKRQ